MNNSDNEGLVPMRRKDKQFSELNKSASKLKRNEDMKLPMNAKYFIAANTFIMTILTVKRKNLTFVGIAGVVNILTAVYYLHDKI
jgi:hypothetical protein